jgi:hypothetical protein
VVTIPSTPPRTASPRGLSPPRAAIRSRILSGRCSSFRSLFLVCRHMLHAVRRHIASLEAAIAKAFGLYAATGYDRIEYLRVNRRVRAFVPARA